jgi:hypothetical protein
MNPDSQAQKDTGPLPPNSAADHRSTDWDNLTYLSDDICHFIRIAIQNTTSQRKNLIDPFADTLIVYLRPHFVSIR